MVTLMKIFKWQWAGHVARRIKNKGNSMVQLRLLPKGDCWKCCPINDEKDVRQNPAQAEQLWLSRPLPEGSYLNPNLPTVIYLHGFTEVAPGESGSTMRDAYLSRGEYNIILVDWGALIALPWYIVAVENTSHAARLLAKLVYWLIAAGIPANTLHIIGFSLGAEAAGIAGKSLATKGITIGRITGLDPAFPLYNLMGRQGRLSSGDAIFVDVIHTNAGIFGYPTPIGDVDFYPNPGSPIQPGCLPQDLIQKKILNRLIGCSHRRAWQYYAESVTKPGGFPGRRCRKPPCRSSEIAYMGIAASPDHKGKFYLTTNSFEPFSINS
ncbi:lipase member H-B-like [Arctopsyche grandis]|uniref:lipase member H-B-like n=1 Tax=Arctopsyche grandis TaxID=121162 RepID=UPI00406DA06D